ncbi:hypothetical protein TWF730_000439 [Orbilia blumenaviensis]|uniref:Uncharacterized protein n=1 Tax=Orbilia blumenaviensis TaxID=1796055 RepID=A0AAV9VNK6_9PEZI
MGTYRRDSVASLTNFRAALPKSATDCVSEKSKETGFSSLVDNRRVAVFGWGAGLLLSFGSSPHCCSAIDRFQGQAEAPNTYRVRTTSIASDGKRKRQEGTREATKSVGRDG